MCEESSSHFWFFARSTRDACDARASLLAAAPRGSEGMNIVFVCTSNTCRSPVAELFAVEWFRRRLQLTREEQEQRGIKILSAACVDRLRVSLSIEFFLDGAKLTRNCVCMLPTAASITDAFEKPGSPASPNAVRVLREYQLDLSHHRSQLLTADMCAAADYVVCLASGHAYMVRELVPTVTERPGVLCVLPRDVPDPWHMPYDTYMENAAQVEELVREFLDKNISWE